MFKDGNCKVLNQYKIAITFHEIILVANDKEAIDPETRKSLFFGVLMRSKGAASVDNNIKAPTIAA